jgi:hypothetical protein
MQPYDVEQSIVEGRQELNQLFDTIARNALSMDSYEAESFIFSEIMKVGHAAMKVYFASVGTGDVGKNMQTSDGSLYSREASLRGRNYFSVFGKLKVPRTCYRKKGLPGIMPLDAKVNFPQRCYSYLLQQWMNLCGVRDSFDESQVTLNSLLGINISQSSFETVNHEASKKYDQFYEEKEQPLPESEGEVQVLQFDGKGVPVIKSEAAKIKARLGKGEKRQRKKEATVGVSFTVDIQRRTPEQVAENLIYPEQARKKRKAKNGEGKKVNDVKSKNIRRMASLERSRASLMEEIVADAKRRDPARQKPWVVVMDGALYLWNTIALALGSIHWIGVLDIIHVVEYLWKVGNSLYGERTKESEKWVYDHLLAILQGRISRVIGGLKQILTKGENSLKKRQKDAIRDTITYFENHKQWMKYDEYLEAGYPIGSGVVESSCGHTVKSRMEGTGRRWSISGAEAMLLLRSVYTSGDWEEYWSTFRKLEAERLYSETLLDILEAADDYSLEKAA